MASNMQTTKSRWGVSSLLQQAVSGVESRLDVLLANEEDFQKKPLSKEERINQSGSPTPKQVVGSVSRSSSNARTSDRLQERLARAVAKSQTAGSSNGLSTSVEGSVEASTPLPGNDARSSFDSSGHVEENLSNPTKDTESPSIASSDPRSSHDSGVRLQDSKDAQLNDSDIQLEGDALNYAGITESVDGDAIANLEFSKDIVADCSSDSLPSLSNDYETALSQLHVKHKASELLMQEEIHGYIERIDALQSKLKYLAKEAVESARKATLSVESGSVEKQLFEKDERIALLLEEGQRLSKTELDHRSTIKKLRQQIFENNKTQLDGKKRLDKLEKDLAGVEARAKRAEAAERRVSDVLSSQTKISRELEAVSTERDSLNLKLQDTRIQLERAVAKSEAAEEKARSDALEQARCRIIELEDDLSSAKVERELSEEKMRRENTSLRESIGREKEGARILETELRGELSVLESKTETLRAKAEEVSSSAAGDAQAKLLRQIETLQSQYAVASENWQGIESSLLSRLANVETERDEIARREADLRRKAREVNMKAKKSEEEIENSRELAHELQRSLQESRQEMKKMKLRLQKVEDDLKAANKDSLEQQKSAEVLWTRRLEDERAKWREQVPSPSNFLHQPPAVSSRKSVGLESGGLNIDHQALSRRFSTHPPQSSDISFPSRQNSLPLPNQIPVAQVANGVPNSTVMGPPLTHTPEPEEYFTGSFTPATPSAYGGQTNNSRGVNDIISVSTVGAGPSVQLVERMSATVRRLESERAASKDELIRLINQRDEARQEVVELMREVEEKRKLNNRVRELETQVVQLDERYQTTLELLGEKSEQVEELRADIADLKKIYRELIDSTMR